SRTADLLNAIQALSQLSYSPNSDERRRTAEGELAERRRALNIYVVVARFNPLAQASERPSSPVYLSSPPSSTFSITSATSSSSSPRSDASSRSSSSASSPSSVSGTSPTSGTSASAGALASFASSTLATGSLPRARRPRSASAGSKLWAQLG